MRKKGFTLIELLAVIIILAIIALIAVPQILGVIEKSRKGAAEVSALGYIDAVEKYMIMHDMDPSKYPYDLKNNTWNVADSTTTAFLDLFVEKVDAESTVPALNTFIDVKGTKPTSGTVTTNDKKVISASLVMNGYNVECENEKCSVEGKSEAPISTPVSTPTPEITSEPTPIVQTYTVHYDANGGQNAPADTIHNPGENSTLSNSEPTRNGYIFLGWSTDSSATTATYSKGSSINNLTAPGETVTLYAVWSLHQLQLVGLWVPTSNSSDLIISSSVADEDNSQLGIKKGDNLLSLSNVGGKTGTWTTSSYDVSNYNSMNIIGILQVYGNGLYYPNRTTGTVSIVSNNNVNLFSKSITGTTINGSEYSNFETTIDLTGVSSIYLKVVVSQTYSNWGINGIFRSIELS